MKPLRLLAPLIAIVGLSLSFASASATLFIEDVNGVMIRSCALDSTVPSRIDVSGDVHVTPQDTACGNGAAQTAPTFPGPLSVTPGSITAGGTVAASWASAGATSCAGTATRDGLSTNVAGWTGTRLTSGTSLPITLATTGAYVFTITCTNTVGSTPSSSSTVVVTEPGSCGGVVPIGGLTRQTAFTNNAGLQGNQELGTGVIPATDYLTIFGNGTVTTFPSRVGQGTLPVVNGKFIALQFNTGTVSSATYGIGPPNPNRFGNFTWSPPSANEGLPLVAISTCPGDFVNIPNSLCRLQSGESTLVWGVGVAQGELACRLQENTTYYLNVAYRDFNSPETSTCTAPETGGGANPGSCHWFMAPR